MTQQLQYCFNNQEWVIAITSAIVGAVVALVSTIVWDNHKNKSVYKSLLKLLLFELTENQKRIASGIENIPQDLRDSMANGNINIDKGVFISAAQVSKLGWTFPKSYAVDAWKTFISSGFAVKLTPELFHKIYKIYDSIDSINFLSNLSVNIFQILAQQNKLDEETNKNFDQFCKFGTQAVEVMLSQGISEVVDDLERIVK